MGLCRSRQSVDFDFCFGHLASAVLIVRDDGAYRTFRGPTHFLIQGAKDVLRRLTDMKLGA